MTETALQAALVELPAELILQILGFLDAHDLASIAGTCRRLHFLSNDDQMWQPLVNENLHQPLSTAAPLKSFQELYIAHHPQWFLPRHRIWFSDSEPSGKLLVSRYNPQRGSIEAYAVAAKRGFHTLQFWEKDREVIIHSFNPQVSLDLDRPVLRLEVDSPKTDDTPNHHPSDRGYGPPSRYSKEILMETFAESGLYSSFMLCRSMPSTAIFEGSQVWPPLRVPARSRTRNQSRDNFNSTGYRPTALSEVSQTHFRVRKWVEYTGRRTVPKIIRFNGISAALGLGTSIRMPEDVNTFSTLPPECFTPTPEKPWQGIWCGDYSGHGCEFILIQQPNKQDERPLPEGMNWLSRWFNQPRRDSEDSTGSYASAREDIDWAEAGREHAGASELFDDTNGEPAGEDVASFVRVAPRAVNDYPDAPSGRLEAIKLTGDPNVPRGEYTFMAPDIGHAGFVRIADEEIFRGARIVRSAGHVAGRGFTEDEYTPSQLIMISHNKLAQFWEAFGHISYYQRVDLDALINFKSPQLSSNA